MPAKSLSACLRLQHPEGVASLGRNATEGEVQVREGVPPDDDSRHALP